jgi:cytochrome c
MKLLILNLAVVVTSLTLVSPAQANALLAEKKNCMGCHHLSQRRVGPAFQQVAAKYAGQADALDKLTQKVLKGGAGSWGAVPMPENRQVNPAEARQLVQWILLQK